MLIVNRIAEPLARSMPEAAPANVPAFTTDIVGGSGLDALAPALDALARHAASPNPYFTPRALEAQRLHLPNVADLRALCVRQGDALAAFLPFLPKGGRLGPWRIPAALTGHYAQASTPLLDAQNADAAADALASGLPGMFLFPLLETGSPAARMLIAALERRGARIATLWSGERPVLERGLSWQEHASNFSRNRRKGLRRDRARLEDLGTVTFEHIAGGPELTAALDDFLHLEQAGWKGRRGTALASRPHTDAFARMLFTPDGREPDVRADVLRLDGRTIAVSMAIVSGGTAYLMKIAHDETLRACAPGVLLEAAIARDFLDGQDATARLDSADLSGGLLDELWGAHIPIADLLVVSDPGISDARLARLVAMERARRTAIRVLKGWLARRPNPQG